MDWLVPLGQRELGDNYKESFMIRNLKVLMLAAMAVAAFGAVYASGASAAGEQFHCEVPAGSFCTGTLSPDGTGKTSHHVFVVKKGASSGAVTCNGLTATSTSGPTSKELTVTGLTYATCNLAGTEASVTTTGCDYLFKSEGGKVNVVCEGANKIKIVAGGCTVEVGSQELSGITYTNINAEKETTVSTAVKNVAGTAGAGCVGLLGFTGAFTEGEYSTGNTIVKAYKDGFAHTEANQVKAWWK